MSLGSALNIAQNSLASVSRRTQVVASNVTRSGDEGYVRRDTAHVSGSPRSATHVSRASIDAHLLRAGLDARSEASARSTLAESLSALSLDLHGPHGERAPAAALSRLSDALQVWSASPADPLLGEATLDAARDVARTFHAVDASLTRQAAALDERIGDDVAALNRLLETFGTANAAIVGAARAGGEPDFDAMDRRDAALRGIAEIVPVATIDRGYGDTVVTTARGATLFETLPRDVSVTPDGIAIDGVPVPVAGDAGEPRGRLEAHLHLRDEVLASVRVQNDALADATVRAFAPSGLFGAANPTSARTIEVPGAYDIATLRAGPPSFADAIIAAAEALETPRTFPATGLSDETGLIAFAGEAVAWLDGATGAAGSAAARSERVAAVLEDRRLQAGGVDVDVEMTRLLALERSYEASARIIAVADRMFETLLAAAR